MLIVYYENFHTLKMCCTRTYWKTTVFNDENHTIQGLVSQSSTT